MEDGNIMDMMINFKIFFRATVFKYEKLTAGLSIWQAIVVLNRREI